MSGGCGVNDRKRKMESKKLQICMIQPSAADPSSADRRAFVSVFILRFSAASGASRFFCGDCNANAGTDQQNAPADSWTGSDGLQIRHGQSKSYSVLPVRTVSFGMNP